MVFVVSGTSMFTAYLMVLVVSGTSMFTAYLMVFVVSGTYVFTAYLMVLVVSGTSMFTSYLMVFVVLGTTTFTSYLMVFVVSGTSMFTAYGVSTINDSSSIRFPNVYFNMGNDYNVTSGEFLCRIPGAYWFSVRLNKINKRANEVRCNMMVNGRAKIRFYTPNEDADHSSASATAGYHLSRDDRVNIGQCGGGEHVFSGLETYFSGILVTPDP